MIGCLIKNIKKGEILIYQGKHPLGESVVRNMGVNALLELIVDMVEVMVAIS